MERRRLERERQKTERTQLSSPKRIPETSVIPDEVSDHEDFEPWEDVEETQNSPRSDVSVSRVGFRVKVLPTVDTRNSWCGRNTLRLRSRSLVYQIKKGQLTWSHSFYIADFKFKLRNVTTWVHLFFNPQSRLRLSSKSNGTRTALWICGIPVSIAVSQHLITAAHVI